MMLRSLLGLCFLLLWLGPALAAEPVPLTAEDLQGFLDPLMAKTLADDHITGAVVAIVKDGAILYAKGYGQADVAAGRPMTADTLVRPGSISKLFTAIAVMQLVEAGRLDLDRDVNDYLDFTVPTPPGGVPVTLRRLLTHRAGFAEHAKDLFSAGPEPKPLREWLEANPPPRLFPNGDIAAYSNHGVGLAGYIVERVAGEPYEAYVESHILAPLGMSHSTFRQPLPPALLPFLALPYQRGQLSPLAPLETVADRPAGALSASANDMARFLLALLGGGRLGETRILQPESWAELVRPEVVSQTGQLGLIIAHCRIGGLDLLGHDGALTSFFSALQIAPAADFGIFLSFDGGFAGDAVLGQLIERYYPAPAAAPSDFTPDPAHAREVAGTYETSRRSEASLFRLTALAQQIAIGARPDGSITVGSPFWPFGPAKPWQEVAPYLFRNPDGGEGEFPPGPEGGRMFVISTPVVDFLPVSWPLNAGWVVPAVAASLVFNLLSLLAWPLAFVVRAIRGRWPARAPGERRRRILLHALLGLDLLVVAALVVITLIVFRRGFGDQDNPRLILLYLLGWLAVAAAPVALAIAAGFWWRRQGSRWSRVQHSLQALAVTLLAYFFVVWHIAGTTLRF
jgi:CubicO group peptidase (beta-lactamase class C family)